MAQEYVDEQIRYVINQVEEQERFNSQNIYEGITIDERTYAFHEVRFFEDKFKIHIPMDFVDMPVELAQIKYPSSDRPQIIKTDDTGSINITLNRIPNSISDEQIPEVKEGIKMILKRLNPSYLFYDEGVETIEEKLVGFFEFKSPTIEDALFNRMFFVEFEHDVIMGVFNCPFSQHMPWRPIAKQIMQSVRVCCDKEAADTQINGGQL